MRHLALLVVLLFAFLVLAPIYASMARAQEAIPRGLGHPKGAAHWYDTACCDKRDCEPVEPGAITLTPEGYRVRYLTSRGFVAEGVIPHNSSGVRMSKDGQEHACATTARVLCVYVHFSM